jgi:hypothetical protein
MKRLMSYCALLTLLACGGIESLRPEEFGSWYLSSPAVNKTRTIGKFQMHCRFVNDDLHRYLLGSDYESNDYLDFTFHFYVEGVNDIWQSNIQSQGQYFDRLAYLNTSAKNDFKLVVNQVDTVPCALLHLERTFGIGPDKLNLSFPYENQTKQISDMRLIYDDKLFNMGRLTFYFSQEDLKHIPTLDYDKTNR